MTEGNKPPLDPLLDWQFTGEWCMHCGCRLVTDDGKTAECPHPACDGYREPVELKKTA